MYFYRCDQRYSIHDSSTLQSRSSFVRFLMGEGAMFNQHPVEFKETPWWLKGDQEKAPTIITVTITVPDFVASSQHLEPLVGRQNLQFHALRHVLHWILVACLPWDFCCFLRRLSCIKGNVAQNVGEQCRSQNIHRSIWSAWISNLVKGSIYTILPKAYWGGWLIPKTS